MREFEERRAYSCGSGEPSLGSDGVSVSTGVALHRVVDKKSTMRTTFGSKNILYAEINNMPCGILQIIEPGSSQASGSRS